MQSEYVTSTRHPWACFLFLLPLLLIYEGGVLYLGGKDADTLRNGADHWMREGLRTVGVRQHFWLPIALGVGLASWAWYRRDDRPEDMLGILSGMGIESVGFALGLWAISRLIVLPLLDGGTADISITTPPHALGQAVTYIGAGIYEETIFRLVLFSVLVWFFKFCEMPLPVYVALAGLCSALIFSLAHHIGPHGEAFEGYVFLFRTAAGMYFALLYHARGFGIAVGAHACYDVVVGVTIT